MGDKRISDEILKQAVEKAREIETSIFEKRFKDTDKHSFSEKYLERMQILKMGKREENNSKIANYSVKKRSTKVKILLIAAIVMLLGALTVTAEPVQEFIFQIKEKLFLDHTDISVEQMEIKVDEAVNKEMFIVRVLEYVPEGYEITEELKDDTKFEYSAKYSNSDNQILTYEQKPIAYIDSIVEELSDLDKNDLSINDEQIYLFKDENEYNIYVHERGSYVYVIRGILELEELEMIFYSRKLVVSEEEYPRKIKIVPEGYVWTDDDEYLKDWGIPEYLQGFYSNFEDQTIIYEQSLIETLDGGDPAITSDGTKGEDISICGEPAKLISDEYGWNTIVYTRGEFIYSISGGVKPELLAECLETAFEDVPVIDKKYKDSLISVGEISGEEVVGKYEVIIYAGGGELLIDSDEFAAYTLPSDDISLHEGEVINKIFNKEKRSWIADVHKEGYRFTGWTIYEGNRLEYVFDDEPYDIEEGMMAFDSKPTVKLIMDNVELYAENISTEELKKIECTGKDFYVIANWEKIE